jgi:LacI family transcriptional regulator
MEETRAATITDVAALAGVSISTVSKAVNGRAGMRPETRDRVLAAASQLSFRPSPIARGLLVGRSYTVGLITSDSFGRFTIPVMLGAEDALGRGQMSVLLCDGRGDPIREEHYVRTLLSRKVDGMIVTGRRTDERPPVAAGLPVPVVYVMTQSQDPGDLSLIPARLRAAGARKALAAAGLTLAGGEALFGEWSEEWGRQAAQVVLRSNPDIDAIFCGCDQIARGVADALREAGRQVPADVALVGYDNWDVFAAAGRPPLTTVDMCLRELGGLAAQRLLAAIDGAEIGGIERHPCRLVIRESTSVGQGRRP